MPFWDDADFAPYEQGGVTGGTVGTYAIDDSALSGEPGGYAGPAGAPVPAPVSAPVDTSKWNTKGYAAPTSAATSSYAAPSGWDQTKWADQNYQDPKYAIGRILMEASGGTGSLKDPAQRQAAIAAIQKAYPGATFNGKDMIQLPGGGAPIDIFRGASSGEYGIAFQPQIPGESGQGGPAASGGGFSAAMGQDAVAAAQAAGGGRQVGGGNYLPADFQYEKFDPSTVDVNSDPGAAFRMKEATRAITNSAAAKGTLISGGFAKALTDRIGEQASQEYGNAFQRALGTNQANNQGGLATYGAVSGAHLGQGNLDLGFTRAGNDYALGAGQLALGNKTADQSFYLGNRNADISSRSVDNSYSLGNGQLGLGWANYGLNADNQNFGQGVTLAGMGQSGAGAMGSYGSTYGNAAGGYMTGAGNAQASGQVGAANAWGQAFGNAGNAAMGAYYAQKYGRAA
jgi:hypothetical protein